MHYLGVLLFNTLKVYYRLVRVVVRTVSISIEAVLKGLVYLRERRIGSVNLVYEVFSRPAL